MLKCNGLLCSDIRHFAAVLHGRGHFQNLCHAKGGSLGFVEDLDEVGELHACKEDLVHIIGECRQIAL